MSITARSNTKKSLGGPPEPGTFLYLGTNGDTALHSDLYSARSATKRPYRKRQKSQNLVSATASPAVPIDNSIMRDDGPATPT